MVSWEQGEAAVVYLDKLETCALLHLPEHIFEVWRPPPVAPMFRSHVSLLQQTR